MKKLVLFFDGCHKIYYAPSDDQKTISEMRSYGYDVIRGKFGTNLRKLWSESCELKFVSPADLDGNKPSVEQFQVGGLKGFVKKVEDYYE